jgi:hypothetical protein
MFVAYAQQGTRVSEQQEFNETFAVRRYNQAACNNVEVDIRSYRGTLPNPQWVDAERGKTLLQLVHHAGVYHMN